MQRQQRPAGVPALTVEYQGNLQPQHNSAGLSSFTDGARRQKRARLGGVAGVSCPPPIASDDEAETKACVSFEGEEGLDVSFPLKSVERNFRCSLCNGYFRDAVTIKECLHTFCRWCLYSYVEAKETEEVCCPFCERNMQLSVPHRDGQSRT